MYRPNIVFCPAERKVVKGYCSKLLGKRKKKKKLDIKKAKKPSKVFCCRGHNKTVNAVNILAIKLLILISISCRHLQFDSPYEAGMHTSCVDISPQATHTFPEGTKHNYPVVPHSTVYHVLYISAKDEVLCWGIWHHDKYALEEKGQGWSRRVRAEMIFSTVTMINNEFVFM